MSSDHSETAPSATNAARTRHRGTWATSVMGACIVGLLSSPAGAALAVLAAVAAAPIIHWAVRVSDEGDALGVPLRPAEDEALFSVIFLFLVTGALVALVLFLMRR